LSVTRCLRLGISSLPAFVDQHLCFPLRYFIDTSRRDW
jgi:hypothetical protein